jgi:hypothetical protein
MTVTAMLRSAELRNHVCSAETVERAPKIVHPKERNPEIVQNGA